MVFSNPTFLFVFLPVVLLGYLLVRSTRFRTIWLLAASVVFYYWGAGAEIWAIAFVALLSFGAAFVVRPREDGTRVPRWVFALAIVLLLGPLIAFKYVPPAQVALRALGVGATSGSLPTGWILPLGISFFTFHAISYVVDVRRRVIPAERTLKNYLLYLFIFPHQIAGPIVRYAEIEHELRHPERLSRDRALYGMSRFGWGLAKKVLIADQAGVIADSVFNGANAGAQLTATDAWIGALAYTFQIYFDFSGYSDMAIGLAALFGFRFPENFNSPYRSIGITDFWRRWHMTLSRWFRDYVYISLGGNRHGKFREYAALMVTFLLTALWHGASVNFLIWGAMHSMMILIERLTGLRKYEGAVTLRRVVTFVFIVFSWVPFRAQGTSTTIEFWRAMILGPWAPPSPTLLVSFTVFTVGAMVVAGFSAFGSRRTRYFTTIFGGLRIAEDGGAFRARRALVLVPILLAVAVCMVLWANFSPFLYFQF